jgi:L,D-transpeptidase catalytic domain
MRPQKLLYASLLAAGLTLPFASAAFAGVDISVDKTTQHMTVSVDGVTRYVFPVSTGRPGYDTPSGAFHPLWMSVLHHSKIYDDAPMPDSIFFTRGYAIHGYTDTPFGAAAVSHGCVRLPPPDAAALFQLVKQDGMAHTTITIHGHIPRWGLVAHQVRPMGEAENEQWAPSPYGFAEQPYGRQQAHGRAGYADPWAAFQRGPPPVFYYGGRGYYGAGAYYQPDAF